VIKCGVHRNAVRSLAPLVTSEPQIDEAIGMFGRALAAADA
jgi:4-aminobutyrate aminotransferase/(S)-3-amino-2-methylpropionate transaminase